MPAGIHLTKEAFVNKPQVLHFLINKEGLQYQITNLQSTNEIYIFD